jgi:protein gp37
MNKQANIENGVVIGRGIEWTDYTWNPVAGCDHGCKWLMPDGTEAICYADTVASKFTKAYPHGFAHHYWHPERLKEPLKVRQPARIFMDSMSDLMGAWVPEYQIQEVFAACRHANWHHFQLLTKNPARLEKFSLPKNLWAGFSAPPTVFRGKTLTREQQDAMVHRGLDALWTIQGLVVVRWMSIEPLSFNIAETFDAWTQDRQRELPMEWAVIGAASNGPRYYQPDPRYVDHVHAVLRENGVKIFHKGNLKSEPHLEEMP